MSTIKDVAKEAGVAISTVSNVLNGLPNISEEIVGKVLLASKKLKYKPNLNAKLLRSGTNKIIAVFLCTIQGQFYASFIQAIQKQCETEGYILQIFIINEVNAKDALRIMTSFGISGCVILNQYIPDELVKRLAYSNIPAVVCDRPYTELSVSSCTLDNYEISCQLMEHLIEQGHTDIGYFHGSLESADNINRFRAFEDTMKKHNLPINPQFLFHGHYDSWAAFYEIERFLLLNNKLPHAIFCANDKMAVGCIKALKQANYTVPEDISIVGFDDDDTSQYHAPPLTTVAVQSTTLGHHAVAELVRLIKQDDLAHGTAQIFPANLIVRDSVKKKPEETMI